MPGVASMKFTIDFECPTFGRSPPRNRPRSRNNLLNLFQPWIILITRVTCLISVTTSNAQNFHGLVSNKVWTPLQSLRFETGDVICCKLGAKFRMLGSMYVQGLEHWFLAYDSQQLVNIQPNAALTETLVAIRHVDELQKYRECYMYGNEKLPAYKTKDMVDAVVGRKLYYNLARCNCKHYSYYWATGQFGGSLYHLSFLPPSRKCKYVLEVNTPPFLNRETVIPTIHPQEQPRYTPQMPSQYADSSLSRSVRQDLPLLPQDQFQFSNLQHTSLPPPQTMQQYLTPPPTQDRQQYGHGSPLSTQYTDSPPPSTLSTPEYSSSVSSQDIRQISPLQFTDRPSSQNTLEYLSPVPPVQSIQRYMESSPPLQSTLQYAPIMPTQPAQLQYVAPYPSTEYPDLPSPSQNMQKFMSQSPSSENRQLYNAPLPLQGEPQPPYASTQYAPQFNR